MALLRKLVVGLQIVGSCYPRKRGPSGVHDFRTKCIKPKQETQARFLGDGTGSFSYYGFPLLALGESLHRLAAERQAECSSTARDKILFYLGHLLQMYKQQNLGAVSLSLFASLSPY